jgi:hypothetical protein
VAVLVDDHLGVLGVVDTALAVADPPLASSSKLLSPPYWLIRTGRSA